MGIYDVFKKSVGFYPFFIFYTFLPIIVNFFYSSNRIS